MTATRRWVIATCVFVIAWARLSGASAATVEPSRLAVVIANSEYSQLGTLKNPSADGRLVASALRSSGFTVMLLANLTDQQFRSALRQVARASAKVDTTLFYYAGHGAQLGGINYLLPTDIQPPENEDDIRLASVSADEVLSVIKSPYKILVLDACRDNPVIGKALSRGRGGSFKRGLAPVAPQSDSSGGVFIAYSTQSDAVAVDGDGANSPFAEAFATHVGSRVSIDDMFALVTRDVLRKTNGVQRPFKYASLDTVFCLSGQCTSDVSPPTTMPSSQLTAPSLNLAKNQVASLRSEKSQLDRTEIETALFEQLRRSLPAWLAYGVTGDPPIVYAFDTRSAMTDGHRASYSLKAARLDGGRVTVDEGETEDYMIDCDAKTLTPVKRSRGTAVKIFNSEERKAAQFIAQKGSVAENIHSFLCTLPTRITPLWVVDSVDWVAVGELANGVTVAVTLDFQYKDPGSKTMFVLERARFPKRDDFGMELAYAWMGIDCGAREFSLSGAFGVNPEHAVVKFEPGVASQKFDAGSVAANVHVLICEKP